MDVCIKTEGHFSHLFYLSLMGVVQPLASDTNTLRIGCLGVISHLGHAVLSLYVASVYRDVCFVMI